MKKRLTVFIFLLTMMVGMLGSVSVYAGEVDYSQAKFNSVAMQTIVNYKNSDSETVSGTVIANFFIDEINTDDYSVYGVLNEKYDDIYYYVCSDSSFTVTYTKNYFYSGFDDYNLGYGLIESESGSGVYYKTQTLTTKSSSMNGVYYVCLGWSQAFANTAFEVVSSSGSGYVFSMTADEYNATPSSYTQEQATAYYLINNVLSVYGDDVSKAPNVSIDEYVEEKDPVYNADLGYLQNIGRQVIYKGASGTNQDYKFKYTYGLTTSTGFDLRTEGADVEYLIKVKGGYKTLFGNYYSLPTVMSDSFYAGNGMSYFYIDSETFNDLVLSFRTDDVPFTASLSYIEYVYMRPILKDGADVFYGLWSKVYVEDGSYKVDYGTTSDGNVSAEGDGEDDDFNSVGSGGVSESLGSGSDWDEAESNSKPSGSTSTTDDELLEQAESLVSQIGEIPQLIATLFSFLPSWCLTLFGVGFGILVLLIIYKLIRG